MFLLIRHFLYIIGHQFLKTCIRSQELYIFVNAPEIPIMVLRSNKLLYISRIWIWSNKFVGTNILFWIVGISIKMVSLEIGDGIISGWLAILSWSFFLSDGENILHPIHFLTNSHIFGKSHQIAYIFLAAKFNSLRRDLQGTCNIFAWSCWKYFFTITPGELSEIKRNIQEVYVLLSVISFVFFTSLPVIPILYSKSLYCLLLIIFLLLE